MIFARLILQMNGTAYRLPLRECLTPASKSKLQAPSVGLMRIRRPIRSTTAPNLLLVDFQGVAIGHFQLVRGKE